MSNIYVHVRDDQGTAEEPVWSRGLHLGRNGGQVTSRFETNDA